MTIEVMVDRESYTFICSMLNVLHSSVDAMTEFIRGIRDSMEKKIALFFTDVYNRDMSKIYFFE